MWTNIDICRLKSLRSHTYSPIDHSIHFDPFFDSMDISREKKMSLPVLSNGLALLLVVILIETIDGLVCSANGLLALDF